jgi:hypothetical protein
LLQLFELTDANFSGHLNRSAAADYPGGCVGAGDTTSGATRPASWALSVLLVVTCVTAIVVTTGRAGADPTHERICSFVSIPQINEGGAMELIVRGPGRLPTCRRVKRIVHLVPKRLSPRTWGMVSGWKCEWARRAGVECRRHRAGISAYPGGD